MIRQNGHKLMTYDRVIDAVRFGISSDETRSMKDTLKTFAKFSVEAGYLPEKEFFTIEGLKDELIYEDDSKIVNAIRTVGFIVTSPISLAIMAGCAGVAAHKFIKESVKYQKIIDILLGAGVPKEAIEKMATMEEHLVPQELHKNGVRTGEYGDVLIQIHQMPKEESGRSL